MRQIIIYYNNFSIKVIHKYDFDILFLINILFNADLMKKTNQVNVKVNMFIFIFSPIQFLLINNFLVSKAKKFIYSQYW